MFYEENVFSEHLKCPHCRRIFVDPRILECGNSMCNNCIMQLLNKENNGLNCKICDKFHAMSENTFNKNLRLARLIEIKPIEFTKSVNDIQGKINMRNLKGHCDFLRYDMGRIAESWYDILYTYECKFMEQIDEFEAERMDEFDVNKYDNYVTDFTREVWKGIYDQWRSYLKKFQIDDNELVKAMKEVEELIAKMEKIFDWEEK